MKIDYYSDILCVWAYVAQVRVEEVQQEFGSDVQIEHRFFSLFGDTATRIGLGWKDKGGYDGFSRHVADVCAQHPHLKLHDNVWSEGCRPASSTLPHLVLQAARMSVTGNNAELDTEQRKQYEALILAFRKAFFEQGVNIGLKAELFNIASGLGFETDRIQALLDDGSALACNFKDNEARTNAKIEGSPTFVLDGGRQKLYGNVGYRVIEANIRELMNRSESQVSWC